MFAVKDFDNPALLKREAAVYAQITAAHPNLIRYFGEHEMDIQGADGGKPTNDSANDAHLRAAARSRPLHGLRRLWAVAVLPDLPIDIENELRDRRVHLDQFEIQPHVCRAPVRSAVAD